MGTTPQQFFTKNMKWILLVVSLLFFVKTFQSCNRNMTIGHLNEEIVELNDSLNTMYSTEKEELVLQLQECKSENITLQHKVDLANTEKDAALRSMDNMRETLKSFRANTTVTIENKSEKDTSSIKK